MLAINLLYLLQNVVTAFAANYVCKLSDSDVKKIVERGGYTRTQCSFT